MMAANTSAWRLTFGRYIYNKRIVILEAVFANLKDKGLTRSILRGKTKVNTQRKLFALAHNAEKVVNAMPA